MKRRIFKVSLLTLIVIVLIFLISILFNEVVYPMTFNEDYYQIIEEHPDWTCDEIGCIYETDDYLILAGEIGPEFAFTLKEKTGNDFYIYNIKDNVVSLPDTYVAYSRTECFVTVIRTIHCEVTDALLTLTPREKMYIREMIGVVRRSTR